MERIKENKKLMIMVIMVVVAIVAAVVIIKPFGGGKDGIDAPADIRMGVYSRGTIPVSTMITEDMVELKEVKGESDANAVRYIEEVIGHETLVEIAEGSAINYEDTEDPNYEEPSVSNGSGLSSKIPEGFRAVLMPTGPVHEIVNYLEVGDRIDLVITHTKGGKQQTITPFQNIEILSLGEGAASMQTPPPTDPEAPQPDIYPTGEMVDVSSVILAMTPKQAEVILNMRLSGLLETAQITLRSNDDEKIEKLDSFGEENFEDWRNR